MGAPWARIRTRTDTGDDGNAVDITDATPLPVADSGIAVAMGWWINKARVKDSSSAKSVSEAVQ